MTQEEKELLLVDLCARLPHGVIVNNPMTGDDDILTYSLLDDLEVVNSDYPKPYLRPMSSMTKEEKEEYDALFYIHSDGETYCENWEWMDWMNAHHFDYRGLIEKGLAIEAPEGMYK